MIRQLLTESIVLATFGGALGLAAYWGVIVALSQVPDAAFFAPDLGTVAFTLCVALGTGILCGLAPALHATRAGVATALKDTNMGATRRSRVQHTFVVAQVMLTQPLLLIVGLIVGTLLTELRKPLPDGISDHVLRLAIDMESTPGSFAEHRAAVDRLVLRIRETPGVVSVLPEPSKPWKCDARRSRRGSWVGCAGGQSRGVADEVRDAGVLRYDRRPTRPRQ